MDCKFINSRAYDSYIEKYEAYNRSKNKEVGITYIKASSNGVLYTK